jgi:DNA-binding CsgD family transcriptional regulator
MDAVDRVIDQLYDGAIDAAAWPHAMSSLCDLLGGAHAVSLVHNATANSVPFVASARIAPDALDRFVPAVTAGPMDWAHVIPPGQACYFDAIGPRAELVKTDFFNNTIRPMGGYYSVVSIPLRESGFDSFVAVCRPERQEDFEDRDVSLLGRIVPHVTRALRTRLKVNSAETRAVAALGAFDQLDIAVAIVDRDLRAVAVNRHADRLLTQGDGLRRARGALSAVGVADDERLGALVARAAADDARVPQRYTMLLRRGQSRPPWAVSVQRLASTPGIPGAPLVTLLIEDIVRGPGDLTAVLIAAFRLTPREALIANALAQGDDLAAIAARLAIGTGTARNHLKSIFRKTHTRRQAELVSLILRLARFGG